MLLLASGCISSSGIPGGPLPRGGGFTVNGAFAAPIGIANADVRSTSVSSTKVRDATADHAPLPMLDRAGVRIAPTSYFDLATDIGLNELGVEARAGLPERSYPFPFAITGGYRRGWEPYMTSKFTPEFAYGRLEVYPLFWSDAERDIYGVFTGGASYGNRFHSLSLPDNFHVQHDMSIEIGAPQLQVLRRETRLEATLGVQARPIRSLPLGFYFMPYVVANRDPRVLQTGLDGADSSTQLVRYQQNFGFIVAVQVGYTYFFERK